MVIEYFNEETLSNCYSTYSSDSQILKVKTCTCSIGKDTCPSHSSERITNGYIKNDNLKLSDISLNSAKHSIITESSVTVTSTHIEPATLIYDELKLSLSSLTSDKDINANQKDKENAFQRWLAEKNRQRKEVLKKQGEIQKYIEDEREKKLEMERQNFNTWLKSKRERAKLEQKLILQEKEQEKRRIREEKEQKQKIAQVKLKLWMKQKEEQLLINKMKEQIEKIKSQEEKQKRMRESMEAYENWLKSSKNKPKPVPLNQGLDTLRTSVSVSFINPMPWVPNIQNDEKTVSK